MSVVILSRDPHLYSTRVLRESFQAAGHEVQVLDVLSLVVKVGQGVYANGVRISPTLVIPRFSAQMLVAGLAVIREWEAEGAGITILNSSASLAVAYDQLATLQCLQRHKLPVPQTAFCSQPKGDATFQSLLGDSPKVIKLLDSSQGNGVTLARDSATGASLLSTLATLRSSGLTQQYYAEAAGTDYRIVVLDGRVVGTMQRTAKEGDFRANLHQGGVASQHRPSSAQCALAIAAAQAIGLRFAGVDLIPTDEGDLILEVNASPGLEGVEAGQEGAVARELISLL